MGLLAAAAVFFWWALKVQFLHGGNWTALYCTGSRVTIPGALRHEGVHIYGDTPGYDGQFYHFMAHDPWLTRGFLASVDNPPLRWRRILMSALAWALAMGQDRWIDPAFYFVVLGFVFLGGYWLAQYFEARGSPAWWGIAFLLCPATLVTLDRIVVDVALAALTAGFLRYAQAGRNRMLWVVLAAAVLARENGLVLVAGWALWQVAQRKFGQAITFTACALPGAAWGLYVAWRTPYFGMPGWVVSFPPMRLVLALVHPIEYPFSRAWTLFILTFDYLAAAGSVLAIGLALAALWRARDYTRVVLPVWGLFGVLLTATASLDVFQDVFSHARLLSPLILLIAAGGAARREWIAVAPAILTASRIGLPLASQALGMLRQAFR